MVMFTALLLCGVGSAMVFILRNPDSGDRDKPLSIVSQNAFLPFFIFAILLRDS